MEVPSTHPPVLESLFRHPVTHLTGAPGAGKSLLLLWYLGRRALALDDLVIWVDAGGSFPPRRVEALFGRQAPAVLDHVLVAQAKSLAHLKTIAAEIATKGVPPGARHVVVDPISRWPRLAHTQTSHSAGQASFVASDFFTGVVEPLVFAGARDGFRLYFAHENSQERPFWWNRYPLRECRAHLAKDPACPSLRGIYNTSLQQVGVLDVSTNPVQVFSVHPARLNERENSPVPGPV